MRHIQKYLFQIFVALIFFGSFGYLYSEEYWEYQNTVQSYEHYLEENKSSNSDFSLEDIDDFDGETKLHTLPDKEVLDYLVQKIDSASQRIYFELYIFTEKQIRDALIRAHNRGVDVKVLLENNPYKAPYLNDKHYEYLVQAGIDVRWSNPQNFSLNHAKMFVIDNDAFISTGNISYSLFTKNRDFIVEIEDEEIVGVLKKLFLLDYDGEIGGVLHQNLVLSPFNSREKMTKLIEESKDTLQIYFPYFADSEFEKVLVDAANRGVSIQILVEKKFYEENSELIQLYKELGVDIRYISSPKIHAKTIISDLEYAYVGSINFSSYSFDNNREIGLILQDKKVIQVMQGIFNTDFSY